MPYELPPVACLARRRSRPISPSWPQSRSERVVAVGDSLTADELSWAEILGEVLRNVGDATTVNLGVGGNTTVHLVGRFADVIAAEPDIVLVIGWEQQRPASRQIRPAHARARRGRRAGISGGCVGSLAEETKAFIWLITPPPALAKLIAVAPEFRRERISWRASDIDRKAALVRVSASP